MTNVPPGWKLVPETPTTEMLLAARTAWLNDRPRRSSTLYAAMVAAAPTPPPSDAYARGWADGREAAAALAERSAHAIRLRRDAWWNVFQKDDLNQQRVAQKVALRDEAEAIRALPVPGGEHG